MRRLLVPLDGSDRGDQILSFLDRLVHELRSCELVLVRVVDAGTLEGARERLAQTAERLTSAGLAATTLTVFGEDPAVELVKVAGLVRPSLVALSTHGAGNSPRSRGSVAVRIIEGCPAPLLLVGRQALPLDPGPGLSRALVALDGSRGAHAVLPLVGELARPSDAEVVLLNVDGREGTVDLDAARDELVALGVDRVRTLRASGDVAEALLAAARREVVDLVAMGARGRTGGPGLGSVARAVALRCDCPLLLAR